MALKRFALELCKPMDNGPAIEAKNQYSLYGTAGNPLDREHITQLLVTGIRAIDALLPVGKGQRIGIFGGSGVGKSTLLGSMSRQNSADVTVIAMIGERNREVRGFLEKDLGADGRQAERRGVRHQRASRSLAGSSLLCRAGGRRVFSRSGSKRTVGHGFGHPAGDGAARDRPCRRRAAQPEGLYAVGFQSAAQGAGASGNFRRGSITGFFTVLVEGDDFNEPICDAVRGILDGHFILSRQLGSQGHYPAIDILHSVSRLTSAIAPPAQQEAARKIRSALAAYRDAEDLIQLGAYVSGSNPVLDASIRLRPELLEFLRQHHQKRCTLEETLSRLQELSARLEVLPAQQPSAKR